MIEIPYEKAPRFFCPKDGSFYDKAGSCVRCNTPLEEEAVYRVIRVCDNCNEKVSSTLEWFESNVSCPSCKKGNLIIPSSKTSHHVVIDGAWDGVDRTKVITEKNEQLRRKHAGYSYEQKSIKERVTKMAQEKGIL